jgi:hypothetical protein
MKNKTAVEWFAGEIKQNVYNSFEEFELLVDQAKEMEKQQIIDAWEDVGADGVTTAKQYYNEIFKDKL